MTLITPLSSPINFGVDALGSEIIADAVVVKWMTLDFSTNQANCECTLPNRPDVCFARTATFDPANITTDNLACAVATAVEASVSREDSYGNEPVDMTGSITPPAATELGQEWHAPDGQPWRVVQARDAESGQFISDDPATVEKESLVWVPAE